jgi:hypothetical protein
MPRPERVSGEVITAKWKTSIHSDEKHFGTITLDGDFDLSLPMLDARDQIPPQTSVLWGLTDRLRRCTAVTLPFSEPSTTYRTVNRETERTFSAQSALRYLLIGDHYVSNPLGEFINGIAFAPHPNKDLHAQNTWRLIEPSKDIAEIKFAPACEENRKSLASAHIAFFEREPEALFEVLIESIGTTVSAWFGWRSAPPSQKGGGNVSFDLRFQTPHTLEAALGETFKLCAFLSLISHQCVYPSNFQVRGTREDEAYELHIRKARRGTERGHTWFGHTLVLPDEHPTKFGMVLRKWYGTNAELLRSRYLYRHSIEEPYTFSTDRFLRIFQAVEGILRVSAFEFVTKDELTLAEASVREALPGHPKLKGLIDRLRNNNRESPSSVLKRQLPELLKAVHISANLNFDEFVDRIYRRRNKSSHGGSHLPATPFEETLVTDTIMLTAIYLIRESQELGLNPHEALMMFRESFHVRLPLEVQAIPP